MPNQMAVSFTSLDLDVANAVVWVSPNSGDWTDPDNWSTGVVPGANMGENHAVFEAVHGSAPDIAGKGVANPTAMMLSSVMMLIHLNEMDAANRLQSAIEKVYAERGTLTPDVGGRASTDQFTDAVIRRLG